MKNIFLSLVALFLFIQCSSREKEVVTLFFNLDNTEVVEINGEKRNTKANKFFRNNDAFYIKRQYFKIKSQIGLINVEVHNKTKYSTIDYLMKKWDESELVSSLGVFKEIYIIEKINNKYYKYKVEWNGNKSLYRS